MDAFYAALLALLLANFLALIVKAIFPLPEFLLKAALLSALRTDALPPTLITYLLFYFTPTNFPLLTLLAFLLAAL